MNKVPFDYKAWRQKIHDNNITGTILSFSALCLLIILLIIADALSK